MRCLTQQWMQVVVVSFVACTCVFVASQDDIPLGAASLAFVFDITGSMYDDLVQVTEGAATILATALARKEKPLYNYVLVPFHDPDIGPYLVTSDPKEFQRELRSLYVQGGGDCPEMSIGAIQLALEKSLPNSFIYVFTDARSKDYYLTDQVLEIIQQKQSQVVFVLTGDCGNNTHKGFKAYEEIASTSSGQVFLLKKSQVNQVLNFVRVAVQARKVNLMSVDQDSARTQTFPIPIDSQLQEITVSVSGETPRIILRDPDGNQVPIGDSLFEYDSSQNYIKELLNIKNVLIHNVKDPTPGMWELEVASGSPHTIRVTGLSTVDFAAGFAKKPGTDFSQTSLRPVDGIPTHVVINATDLDPPATLTRLELVDLKGEALIEFPVSRDPTNPALYNVTSFIPPNEFFYLKVDGIDHQGYVLRRTTPTAISPRVPTAPTVSMPDLTRGFFDQTATLTCTVQSLVPYTVRWFRRGVQMGYDMSFYDSANATLEVPRAGSSSEGDYVCNATNIAGSATTKTYLDISDPPPVISKTWNISVLPGESAILTCNAFSTVEFNMTWYKPGRYGPVALDPRVSVLSNGSLFIRNVQREDVGRYVCKASNEGGSTEDKVFLRLQEPPIARTIPRSQNFLIGRTINITCVADGYPPPNYSWMRGGKFIVPTNRIYFNDGVLIIKRIKRTDEGDYECLAKNPAGEDIAIARVNYIEAPRIRQYERRMLVATGDRARLTCEAEGIPRPEITWYRGDRKLQSAYNVDITRNGRLIIRNVQEMDAGDYRCVVSNEAGSDNAKVTLEVGSPPEIIRPPGNVGIEIERNGTLECEATGMPPPKIIWRRGDGKPLDINGRFQQLPSGGLHVSNIGLGDEGIYTCLAQNAFGVNDASAFVSVTGIVRPLIAYTYPIVKVQQGEKAELECVVLLGKPTPKINWMKNGRVLSPGGRIKKTGPGKIVISNITHDDDGEYVCHASNIGGNATYSINVDVLVPPRLIQDDLEGNRNFSVNQGKGIVLPCRAVGDPRPTFQWYKDGSPISLSDIHYFVRNDGSLEIFSADPSDTGSYKCVASNIAGGTEKVMTLDVRIAPSIDGALDETYEILEHQTILLPCNPTGKPKPKTFWRRNFTPFRPRSSRIHIRERGLFIKKARLQDKAIYECVASNVAGNTTKVITLIVFRPPTINAGPSYITVMEGDPVLLECETDGDPTPIVTWKKNNTIMDVTDPDSGVYMIGAGSLTLDSVRLTDAAMYTCNAKNPAGEAYQDFRLVVHAPPQIAEDLPTYTEVIENNPVILRCPATGTPTPKITWLKDGVQVSSTDLGVTLRADGNLEIDNALAADSGIYVCIVENVAGNDSHAVNLKILIPPKLETDGSFNDDVDKPTVIVNNTITIRCPVAEDVDPPPIITWYRNGQLLLDDPDDPRIAISDSGLELIITWALISDTARYKCIAVNPAGEAEKKFDLDVLVPPTIDEDLSSPNNMTVVVGQPLYINCPIGGIPPPVVNWFKDGQPLSPELDPNINVLANGRRLEVTNAKVTDRGLYMCFAENVAGKLEQSYEVYVHVPPEVEKPGEVESTEVIKNGTLRLRCPISGIPPPKITWLKDEFSIKFNTSKYTLLEDGWVLEIKFADITDRGRHYCLAKNIAGENEKAFDVEVLVPPQINRTNTVTDPNVIANSTAVISCPVTGNPQPEILWYRNNVLLDARSNPRYEILASGRQLRIYRTQIKDAGQYTCASRNRAGEENINFNLDVWVAPTINTQGSNFEPKVIVNSTIDLDCPAEGNPLPAIRWFRDGSPLNTNDPDIILLDEGMRLQIRNAAVEDSARYTCQVNNPAGEEDISYDLSVHVPPEIRTEGVITDPKIIENETLTLDCPAEGVPVPEIVWLQEGQPIDFEANPHMILQDGGRRLIIQGVNVPDAGNYLCVASNEAGEVEQSYDLEVWVPPHIDDTARNTNPRVIKGLVATMTCPVSGIPFPDITWLRNNREIEYDSRVEVLNGGLQLRVQNSSELDTAVYSCIASSPAGEDRADFDLVVLVKPDIDESNVVYNPKVTEGRRVLLECPVSGIPIPEVEWLINGSPLVPSDEVRILNNNRHLEIVRALVKDTAQYTCIATNEAGQLERTFSLEVLVPPSIDRSLVLENPSVHQNKTVRLNCPVDGVPPPSILWLKDRVPLVDFPYRDLRVLNGDTTLEVSNAQLDDAGNYTCRALNQAGTDEVVIKLDVFVPPVFNGDESPEMLEVVTKQPITLPCNISGTPKPSILWMKDGEIIVAEDNPNIIIENGGMALKILEASIIDTARYTCHAENQAGFIEKQYDLEVLLPPTINGSEVTQNVPVILDQSVTLECPADGIPPPEIRWFRSGELIPQYGIPNIRILDNGRKLYIISAQLLDFGAYSCQAINTAGEASLRFEVSVMVPPEIAYGATQIAAEVNTPTVLQCETSGQPQPNITWTKDGSSFPSTGLRHRMLRSGSLEFSRIMIEDAGTYECTATNSAGSATRTISVDVQVPAKILNVGSAVVKSPLSTGITLPCEVEGTPTPRIFWLKNRALLQEDEGSYHILSNGSLHITDLQLYHRGVYTCIAQNRAGSSKRDITLQVQVPPTISMTQRDFVVLQNRTAVMPCSATGIPKPKIRWEKDGKEITSTNYGLSYSHVHYITLQNGGLAIPHARALDAGTYTCIAENQAGNVSESVSLTVEVPPKIKPAAPQFVVTVGDRATLPCEAGGRPAPRISWTRDGSWISSRDPKYTLTDEGSLIIERVEAEDTGSYVCTADNTAGRDSQSRLLRVQVPPRIIIHPLNKEVTINKRLELVCAADGVPIPTITWLLNGKPVAAPVSINGRSVYFVRNAIRADSGEYTCVATNPANNQQVTATANVVVKVPPRMLVPPGNKAVKIAEKVVLECSVGGDPIPEILWTKNGRAVELSHRIQQLSNGSLVIYDSTSSDAGEYKCIAVNTAGTSESRATVTVWSEPTFKIEPPKSQKVDQGETIIVDCTASGDPKPDMYWWKETTPLVSSGRITVLPNNSLRIVATQLDDSGLYRCFATNKLGKTFVETDLKVVVHGGFSEWGEFGECSTTCGAGLHFRTRSCDNPPPTNGGQQCIGAARESKSCIMGDCPVDASWGNWGAWKACSSSCGPGQRTRSRLCDNPPPQFGGLSCEGPSVDQSPCNVRPCPIDGNWGDWDPWSPCTTTCGEGQQTRERKCNNPRPQFGGLPCLGAGTDRQACHTQACAVDGNWGQWMDWTSCSVSCGGGSRTRVRRCDNPRSQYGGADCVGPEQQVDYCNSEHCPVHGNWALWSTWGECSRSCGGGQMKRFRTCTNPIPAKGGRPCTGQGEEITECNQQYCPVDGSWGPWAEWGACSKTCDYGTRERRRQCVQPQHGGRPCLGNGVQVAECIITACDTSPRTAEGNLVGNINNIDIVESTIVSEMTPTDSGIRVRATIRNVPRTVAPHLQHLISLLTPVYWTTAMEVDGAYNGYTLTKGVFNRKVQVEFATGEVLRMTHYATGVDDQGKLKFDIVVSGHVPDLGQIRNVYIHPYTEQYVQTGPGEIYAYSSRLFRVNGNRMPYAWNHTITYDPSLGKMPFLVQQLFAEGMEVNVEPGEEDVRFQLYASIAPGNPSNRCPRGFFHDEEGSFCRDDNECSRLKPCSHFCHNAPGSFSCSCPVGFTLEPDGRSCRDIDECQKNIAGCPINKECVNTIGSYQCLAQCSAGYKRALNGLECQDIDECKEQPDTCEHVCENLVGSFRCSCTQGYRLSPNGRCVDIDECKRPNSPCPQKCLNTNGGYRCACRIGYNLVGGRHGACRDINECIVGTHNCPRHQECVNTRGSYECINICEPGFRRLRSGQCIDINECTSRRHRCYYNQRCVNTAGSYKCTCPQGLASRGPGQPCTDINECEQIPPVCNFKCRNLWGSFECICPFGQVRLTDKKTCAGLEFLEPAKVYSTNTQADQGFPSAPYRSCKYGLCALKRPRLRCPSGTQLARTHRDRCFDIDECALGKHQCQHNCTNTNGSYRCRCPPGYRLGKDGFSCVDINECIEKRINCGFEKMCFNTRGSHSCIDIPCPVDYARDPTTQFCVLECVNPNIPCPPGAKYADVIQFRTLSLPSGNIAQDLIRLTAYNQNDEILIQTTFKILDNDPKIEFMIRLENGKGVVFTKEPLQDNQVYRIKVRAKSYDNRRLHIQYQTTFIIHISVSAWPY
ncbi:hemicentin-1-like isoform X1 [Haliotis asinina]|uniref:hemicentin-1-like isoform X1 n=1 Tax=Haliotis asinina TaxID=109174 RepID=UPI0035327B8A